MKIHIQIEYHDLNGELVESLLGIDPTAINIGRGASIELRLLIESIHRTLANMYPHHTNDSWMQGEIKTARELIQKLQSKLGV